jgi:intraflagellar transport protein 20
MATENENEQRSRKQRSLETLLKEKRSELDRYTSQYQSLERIESEQNALLEKLTNAS